MSIKGAETIFATNYTFLYLPEGATIEFVR